MNNVSSNKIINKITNNKQKQFKKMKVVLEKIREIRVKD
jgi:hypothetical protein